MEAWHGFHHKPLLERQQQVLLASGINTSETSRTATISSLIPALSGLDLSRADAMVENCIGIVGVPLGVGLYLRVNGRSIDVVPMATEVDIQRSSILTCQEPSVIAAVSSACKMIALHSIDKGFVAVSGRNIVIAQVQLHLNSEQALDTKLIIDRINEHKKDIIQHANTFCPQMKTRGGGVFDVSARHVQRRDPATPGWIVVHLHIDACEAMGANIASRVAEGAAHFIAKASGCRAGVCILSNLSTDRIVKVTFAIPTKTLEKSTLTGNEVARRIVDAYEWADNDPYRASTHNKGIMNGIGAVALACGQDWRALESACYSHVALNTESRLSMSKYWISDDKLKGETMLNGSLEVPMPVGVVGGSLKSNPAVVTNLQLLGTPSANELAEIIASIGLAQNFAALKALVTDGIQKGHMQLHARNIALEAGCPIESVGEVVLYMIQTKSISVTTARNYSHAVHLDTTTRNEFTKLPKRQPNLLIYRHPDTSDYDLSIAFQSFTDRPIVFEFGKNVTVGTMVITDRTEIWIHSVLNILDKLHEFSGIQKRAKTRPQHQLRILIVLLISIILHLVRSPENRQENSYAARFGQTIAETETGKWQGLLNLFGADAKVLEEDKITASLVVSVWLALELRIKEWVSNTILQKRILTESRAVISNCFMHDVKDVQRGISFLDTIRLKPRYPMSLLLKIDLLLVDDALISTDYLGYLDLYGILLNIYMTVSHDLSDHRRGLASPLSSTSLWSQLNKTDFNQHRYLQETTESSHIRAMIFEFIDWSRSFKWEDMSRAKLDTIRSYLNEFFQ